MRIWIDLANAPHVNFFKPLVRIFCGNGHSVKITIRDFNQTPELASHAGINGCIIGKHGGKGTFRKLVNLIMRAYSLYKYCRKKNFDVAISHNSYAQTIAGRLAGIRVITLMDYEGQPANHIGFRAANHVMVPDCFSDKDLRKFGAHASNVYKYHGFKEQIYLSDFKPDPFFPEKLKNACNFNSDWKLNDNILVTVRTPATLAAYHQFHNCVFDVLLKILNNREDIITIILPRYPKQKQFIQERFSRLHIPSEALSGEDLTFYSDIVISGGGTMNREAAILGTPVYTIFGGTLPAVDRKLIEMGRLVSITTVSDLNKINFHKKTPKPTLNNKNLIYEILSIIEQNPITAFDSNVLSNRM